MPRVYPAQLADRLIASLFEDHEVEEAWAVEVERRIEEIESGRSKLIPAAESVARARAAINDPIGLVSSGLIGLIDQSPRVSPRGHLHRIHRELQEPRDQGERRHARDPEDDEPAESREPPARRMVRSSIHQ
jgi:hypothetical protein